MRFRCIYLERNEDKQTRLIQRSSWGGAVISREVDEKLNRSVEFNDIAVPVDSNLEEMHIMI